MKKIEVGGILARYADLNGLVRLHPESFDFTDAHIDDKIKLLRSDVKFFIDKIGLEKTSTSDKVRIIVELDGRRLAGRLELTEKEISDISDTLYFKLLQKNFTKYINAARYETLSKNVKSETFCLNPEWMVTNIGSIPILTKDVLNRLSNKNPQFLNAHVSDFSKFSTDSYFWGNMIKFDSKYKDVFLQNMGTCITKTDIRQVFWNNPTLIKKVDSAIITKSKLTAKEWTMLINNLKKDYKELVNWEVPEDLVEALRLDLTAEMLNGTSRLTAQMKNAMKRLENIKDDEN